MMQRHEEIENVTEIVYKTLPHCITTAFSSKWSSWKNRNACWHWNAMFAYANGALVKTILYFSAYAAHIWHDCGSIVSSLWVICHPMQIRQLQNHNDGLPMHDTLSQQLRNILDLSLPLHRTDNIIKQFSTEKLCVVPLLSSFFFFHV